MWEGRGYEGLSEPVGWGELCVEIRVYADIFYESRCNSAVKLKSELIFITF